MGRTSRVRRPSQGIEPRDKRGLPLVGTIAGGVIRNLRKQKRVDFADLFQSRQDSLCVFVVHGEGMIDDGIADGDYVIIDMARRACPGDVVVVVTEDNQRTMGRYSGGSEDSIQLETRNSEFKNRFLSLENAHILGVTICVVRRH
jgi:repressor LexA